MMFVENLPSPHNNNNKVIVFAPFVREISSNPEKKCLGFVSSTLVSLCLWQWCKTKTSWADPYWMHMGGKHKAPRSVQSPWEKIIEIKRKNINQNLTCSANLSHQPPPFVSGNSQDSWEHKVVIFFWKDMNNDDNVYICYTAEFQVLIHEGRASPSSGLFWNRCWIYCISIQNIVYLP